MQSVLITTKTVSLNPVHGMVYSMQYYVIKFVNDLRKVSDFPSGIPISSTNKTDIHDITEILLKVTLNTINQTFLCSDFLHPPQMHANYCPLIKMITSLHHICFGKDIAGTGSGECVRADIQAW